MSSLGASPLTPGKTMRHPVLRPAAEFCIRAVATVLLAHSGKCRGFGGRAPEIDSLLP